MGNALPSPAVLRARELLALHYGLGGESINPQPGETPSVELPIRMNDQISSLRLYVINPQAVSDGSARAFLSLGTSALGTVRGMFSMNNGQIHIRFESENAAVQDLLNTGSRTLTERLRTIRSLDSTQEYYSVASAIVKHIESVEEGLIR
jgi:hypothetical protein